MVKKKLTKVKMRDVIISASDIQSWMEEIGIPMDKYEDVCCELDDQLNNCYIQSILESFKEDLEDGEE